MNALRAQARASAEELICKQLLAHRGNVSATAAAMRIGRATLYRWIGRSLVIRHHLARARGVR